MASRYHARASRPSAPLLWLRGIFLMAQPPLLCEEGNMTHSSSVQTATSSTLGCGSAALCLLWLFPSSFRSPKQSVRGLQDDPAEPNRVILFRIQKCPNRVRGDTSAVSGERGVHPIFGKENIAGALNVAQQFQGRPQVFFGLSGAQRVMQIMQSFDHPWFTAAILHIR